jgi:3-phenylpropionate/cinnamic acid dioxygenase small subunit
MPGNDPIVQELRDRMAIRDLIMRYAHSVDARDFVGVASCFTADAAYQGSLGVGTIADALDSLRVRMQRFRVTMHFLSTQVIELAGDTARCETYGLVYHRLGEEEENDDLIVGVRYLDELGRQPDGWRIRRREVRLEFERFDAVVLQPGEPSAS